MGKKKYTKVDELFKKSAVVQHSSIKRIVGGDYAKQLVRNLQSQGKIQKLTKGCYTTRNNASLAVFCYAPAYLGLQDSLSQHNLWEQETVPVIITSRKIRPGRRQVLGMNIQIHRIDRKYLFGLDYLQQEDSYLPYSDIEKTLIDMVYFKENISKEVVREIRKSINTKKLTVYLAKYSKPFRLKVIKVLRGSS